MLLNNILYMLLLIDTSYIHDNKKSTKLAVELGVGIGLALLVAIVLCVAGIVYYRRWATLHCASLHKQM